MNRLVPVLGLTGGLLLLGFMSWSTVVGQPQPAEPGEAKKQEVKKGAAAQPNPAQGNIVRQGFPAGKADPNDLTKSETAWEIEWTITNPDNGTGKSSRPSSVLAIRSAKFMYKDKNGNPRWIKVLENLQLGEMFVPYDNTSPTYYDIARFSFHLLPAKREYLGPNCVAPGEILASADPRMHNKVLKEVHDDGLRWLNGKGDARRGEKMMLWSLLSAGNYRYLIEYTFNDDGIITCRVGATAHNHYPLQDTQRDVHLHVGCWRWDMVMSDPENPELGGADKNMVTLVSRLPKPNMHPGHFLVDVKPLNADEYGKAREGYADWEPEKFTTLRITSKVRKNGNNSPKAASYDVIPLRYGSVRNYPKSRDFINHDFWVTRTDPAYTTYEKVAEYAAKHQTLDGHPVTIWHNSPGIHVPRAEDFGTDGVSNNAGVAITVWSGFILRPRNLFDSTPLYPTKKK